MKIEIAVFPEEVWPLVADPEGMMRWNEKLVAVERSRSGTLVFGECFEAVYRMSGKETRMQCNVERAEPPTHLAIRHGDATHGSGRVIVESYELRETSGGTHLVQRVDLSAAGLPWWVRPLLGIINRFGTPQGESHLERLKRLAEKPDAMRPA